jgi:radical SAM superfamily enzyme YgiQ (UPF0313 family)
MTTTTEKKAAGTPELSIWLADLTYTQQTVAADVMPQAVGGIATFTEARLQLPETIRIFKYPEKLVEAAAQGWPDIIGFSNYIWNYELSYEFAKLIKEQSPNTVVVFGGPNYPVVAEEQKEWLLARPAIDFYIQKEGELAFSRLVEALIDTGGDIDAIRGRQLPSVHFVRNGEACLAPTIDRIRDLTEIPSPYATGRMDEFFDGVLMPIIQTNRGCPFSCTFCVEGVKYYNKVYRNSIEKVSLEIDYIGRKMAELRSKGGRNDLFIADSNFGMYAQDIDVCRALAKAQQDYQWPEYINVATGKNQKERVLAASRLIDGALRLSGSVQSLDPEVLANIKRSNISAQGLMDLALAADEIGANSYSEIILGLPGDSKERHSRTVQLVMEAGFTNIYLFQLMLLPGTELATLETKAKYQMDVRCRVLPRCYGHYTLGKHELIAAEIEEICVANSTLSFEDYLECRRLHLVVTLFYNDSLFLSVLKLLRMLGLSPWRWMELLRDETPPPALAKLFASFRRATREELWTSRRELEEFIREPGIVEKYIAGELGNNLLFVHKSRAITELPDELAEFARKTAAALLCEGGKDDDETMQFLDDAVAFHLCRMKDLFTGDHRSESAPSAVLQYDIRQFLADKHPQSVSDYTLDGPVRFEFMLDEVQLELVKRYLAIYGNSPVGIGRILSKVHTKRLFRHSLRPGEAAPRSRIGEIYADGLQS